ncbi:MAG TPA: aspartate:alanine exchanger family transporter [Acidobacteriota bacterium]|nr:aspartate:alanine exchanger family transporter [Acidobacteriota bacterium]HRR25656.1 aspartate:alanine exchanger family transporter [Acidobacteriota bacterium]HRV06844.1 aspartate:alanine exchanger family transporter [Acidobacteriota bacterium]
METFLEMLRHPVALLFVIVALGSALGSIRVARISLGASGVLFVALLFGHLGYSLPTDMQELGIILFVYAVGLQAGPRFFNQFRERGILFAKIGLLTVAAGASITGAFCYLFKLDPALAVGMYAGALTSTPGLAAAMDAARDPRVSVGFGLAYPFGVVGVVLLVQLLPRLLRIDLRAEEERLARSEDEIRRLQLRQFRITNPACVGKTLSDLQVHRFSQVNITRISRGGTVVSAREDTPLALGDVVAAVGRADELKKLELVLGESVQAPQLLESRDVIARDAVVSSDVLVGKTLAELGVRRNYGVVISRVFREDLDFAPGGNYRLELGDTVRVVGERNDVEKFVQLVGQQEKRIHETNMTALAVGVVLGVLLAYQDFPLPGGASFRLGLAGGPLFVSLVLAHFGRIGRLNIRTPRGAKYILQQLGLVLFLTGAGTAAGGRLGETLVESGWILLLCGAGVTVGAGLFGFIVSRYWYGLDQLSSLGALCGGMTSTPALGAVTELTQRSEAVIAYTSVYPVGLIAVTVCCQLLYYLL